MKLVIDIPESMYNRSKKPPILSELERAVANGTPLPKGHGDLKDADELIKRLESMANEKWNQQVGSSKGLEDAIDIIEDAPTIIEADKDCTDCILDGTDACTRGAGRAVDAEVCEDFIEEGKSSMGYNPYQE